MLRPARVCFASLMLLGGIAPAFAVSLTAGNIIVSNDSSAFYEYTPAGVRVQAVAMPTGRDLVLDNNGNIEFYNGTFSPMLTTYNPATGQVLSNRTFPGWSTVNNVTYGAIAAYGNYVYVTDMQTANDGGTQGIIRFNINDGSAVRFDAGDAPINLNIGRDGLLYSLSTGSAFNGGGNAVSVFNPTTLAPVRSFTLPSEARALAVDAQGQVYAAGIDSRETVTKYSKTGATLGSITFPTGGHSSINLTAAGQIVISSFNGELMRTDTNFSYMQSFGTRSSTFNWAAWVQPPVGSAAVPEPGSIALLLGMGSVGLFVRRKCRNQ